MTEVARRWLGSLQKHVATALQEAAEPPGRVPPLRLEIHLPDALLRVDEEDLTRAMRVEVSTMLADLRIDRGVAITVQGAGPGATAATASIDGRPVAYVRTGDVPAEVTADAVLEVVVSRLLRRLPLLGGPGTKTDSTAAYLLALGCGVPAGTPGDELDVEAAEQLVDSRSAEVLVLEVAASTMRRVDEAGISAMLGLREAEFRKRGIAYPDLDVVLTDDRPGSVRLRLNDVRLPGRQLGEEAGWADVVRYVGEELAVRRHWFVRMRDVARVLDQDLQYVIPHLVAVTEANYSRAHVTACLRELVRSGRRIRNVPRIMWLLIEAGGTPAGPDILRMSESPLLPKSRHRPTALRDPVVQAVRVRKLAAEENWRLGTYREPQQTVRLAEDVEERLVSEWRPDLVASAEWAAVRALGTAPGTERVVTRTVHAVGPVRDALQAVADVPRVLASHELPPDADVGALPVLTDPDDPS